MVDQPPTNLPLYGRTNLGETEIQLSELFVRLGQTQRRLRFRVVELHEIKLFLGHDATGDELLAALQLPRQSHQPRLRLLNSSRHASDFRFVSSWIDDGQQVPFIYVRAVFEQHLIEIPADASPNLNDLSRFQPSGKFLEPRVFTFGRRDDHHFRQWRGLGDS